MTWLTILINILYLILGGLILYFASAYAHNNLVQVNRIRGSTFNIKNWSVCLFFGIMVSMSSIFGLNLLVNFFSPTPIYSIASYLLILELLILIIYPIWEIFFLGRPTSDAITDYHKFLERKFIDKAQGKKAYFVSFLIFVLTYITPIILITLIFQLEILPVAFLWSLSFPLFFIAYYAASGLMVNVLGNAYKDVSEFDMSRNSLIQPKKSTKISKTMNKIQPILAWFPFLLEIWNIILPMMLLIRSGQIQRNGVIYIGTIPIDIGLVSLIAVIFVIRGFVTRFWVKKSKTKALDFVFTGYIVIAISLNIMIHFITLNPTIIERIFIVDIGGTHPLQSLQTLLEKTYIMLPILIIQHTVTLIYAIKNVVKKNAQYQADIRLTAVHNAAGDLPNLIFGLETISNKYHDKSKNKKKKINFPILIKSIMLEPEYSHIDIDINEQIREKASQYVILACKKKNQAIELVTFFISQIKISVAKHRDMTINRHSIDILGRIGQLYPKEVIIPLFKILIEAPLNIKREILKAIAHIGKFKANTKKVLDMLLPFLNSPDHEIKTISIQAISELYFGFEDSLSVLDYFYQILENDREDPYLIEKVLTAMIKLCCRHADKIEVNRILPFLNYQKEGTDTQILNYVLQNSIVILGHIAHIAPEKIPKKAIEPFLEDSRNFIRYVTTDTMGNYMLATKDLEILQNLFVISIQDPDEDVRDMAIESIQEFLMIEPASEIIYKKPEKKPLFDLYLEVLLSSNRKKAENASEALKSITPLYKRDIFAEIEPLLHGKNDEIIRDCLNIIPYIPYQESINLETIYSLMKHHLSSIREEAINALGLLAEKGYDIDEFRVIWMLEDDDPQCRFRAIFALGKIGIQNPRDVVTHLIRHFYRIDHISQTQELMLIFESLGLIGIEHPSRIAIALLQQALMGDTNPLCKDVAARALFEIGRSMIQKGKAIQLLQHHHLDPKDFSKLLDFFKIAERQEYDLGDVIMILIEALQLKGIPDQAMFIIGDSLQDLLPAFLFYEKSSESETYLETLKELIKQIYHANYSKDILILVDRITSLQFFKKYVEEKDKDIQKEYLFYTKNYTPDAEQFFGQGELFMGMHIPNYQKYAEKSFEIAIELGPNEIFMPLCYLYLGTIAINSGDKIKAKNLLEQAIFGFAAFDDVKNMKRAKLKLREIA
ncbi:hypothetical protein [Candidatus Lokiarchaeum ossiferum]|uniref:hypothetical protein n=1 Tax=Candidatus Lokiarchaeum ossiferum TaxID=2951803 RepID=UPI00352DA44F